MWFVVVVRQHRGYMFKFSVSQSVAELEHQLGLAGFGRVEYPVERPDAQFQLGAVIVDCGELALF